MSEQKRMIGVASSPHVSSKVGTCSLMLDVLIALVPALLMAMYFFGPRALTMTLVSMVACGGFEFGYNKLVGKTNTLGDLSAMITGVLVAFVVPVTLPYWILIIGDFFAIVVVKQLFGGLGKNFMNPALGGRAFLMLSYPVAMTTWVMAGTRYWPSVFSSTASMVGGDLITGATPLANDIMKSGLLPETLSATDVFLGNVGGCIGETSAFMLLLGGLYLLVRGVIKVRIPATFIGTVAVLSFLFPPTGISGTTWMLYQLFSGGLMLGAFFMATDYVTSPCTPRGEIMFGIGCGLLTVFIRNFGGYPEGVSYAILLMNACVWLFDQAGKPSRFGVTAEYKKKKKAEAKAAKEAMKEVAGHE